MRSVPRLQEVHDRWLLLLLLSADATTEALEMHPLMQKCFKVGQSVVNKMRHGAVSMSSEEVEVPEFTGWLDADKEESSPLDAFRRVDFGKRRFELEQVSRLRREMKELNHIMQACELRDKFDLKTNQEIYRALRQYKGFEGLQQEAVLGGPETSFTNLI